MIGKLGEPLAVDVRREGDGKQAAFLKLVAGLLADMDRAADALYGRTAAAQT